MSSVTPLYRASIVESDGVAIVLFKIRASSGSGQLSYVAALPGYVCFPSIPE